MFFHFLFIEGININNVHIRLAFFVFIVTSMKANLLYVSECIKYLVSTCKS